ncbi:MAG: site-2 protease family protein [Patescibacteria group bacterium]|nr:site-2 protease family protein [Patescibacteria group bacterium]
MSFGLLSLLFTKPIFFFTWMLAVVIGITVHEFCHALAASVQGDQTARNAGRLTLNPLAHLDPLGTVMLLILGFGYGRPVPFNPYNLRNKRFGPALVGLAGPVSNLLMVAIFGILLKVFIPILSQDNLLVIFLIYLIQINVVLLVFNLFPVPPLDGSKVLFAILPASQGGIRLFLEQYGPWVLLGVLLFGGGIFSSIFEFFLDLTYRIIS